MWQRRVQLFIQNFRAIKGIKERRRYFTWCFRRLTHIILLNLANKISSPTLVQAGVPANVAFASGLEKANLLGYVYFNKLKLSIGNYKPHINIVVPSIAPGIIFGGYISIFSLAARLITQGYAIRFIVTESMPFSKSKLLELLEGYATVSYALKHADIINAIPTDNYAAIPVSKRDIFVAYSAFTALLSHYATKEIGQEKFIFYIQEEEGLFHSNNSFKATIEYIYTLPHIAIFNSPMLENYFKTQGLGVFNPLSEKKDFIVKHLTFKHALSNKRSPTRQEIISRKTKKLLFFARPEQHAERNLFEIGLVALKVCCQEGIFKNENWEFHAIGAMNADYALNLGGGHVLRFLPRQPLEAYAELLLDYDIGLSLMFAPHPSVPNFEMAAAGMPTVTTTFINRTKDEMESVCPNFIAVPPHIEGVVEGIKEALYRVGKYDDRIKNANFKWPRNWDESFDETWLTNFNQLLALHFGSSEVIRIDLMTHCYDSVANP